MCIFSSYSQNNKISLDKPVIENKGLKINFHFLKYDLDSTNLSILKEVNNILEDYNLNNVELIFTPYLCENEMAIDKFVALKRTQNIIDFLYKLNGDKIIYYNIAYNNMYKFDKCNEYGIEISITHP